ncbi:hypothetical protein E1301_Tti019095 [Triplophysa tibetana]|uniref:Ig-like domain-containing protein n=1 Tax=Triplophysa tibetana TaxID=1572043 RepID=A0A5A9NPX0_9TELE|nr:hypothetical protein E1301_Tti019095 [Triplophysa tibetana]
MDFFFIILSYPYFVVNGVFGDEVKSVSVMEGESVTLHTDVELQTDDVILWNYRPENTFVAIINWEARSTKLSDDERFRDRLEVNNQTGDLTISDIRTTESGLYTLMIRRNNEISNKNFNLTVNGVFGAQMDQINSLISVTEGDSVTLHTNITELKTDEDIEWTFGVQSPDEIIATIYKDKMTSSSINETLNLKVNDQTGSLIITNITTQHTGLYKVTITNAKLVNFIYRVIVYVMNVSHDVSVSWYKGKSLLSSISVSDLNIRLSLPLEVEYQDTNTYRCVVNNPITNLTQHLHITQLCQTCAEICNGGRCGVCWSHEKMIKLSDLTDVVMV